MMESLKPRFRFAESTKGKARVKVPCLLRTSLRPALVVYLEQYFGGILVEGAERKSPISDCLLLRTELQREFWLLSYEKNLNAFNIAFFLSQPYFLFFFVLSLHHGVFSVIFIPFLTLLLSLLCFSSIVKTDMRGFPSGKTVAACLPQPTHSGHGAALRQLRKRQRKRSQD